MTISPSSSPPLDGPLNATPLDGSPTFGPFDTTYTDPGGSRPALALANAVVAAQTSVNANKFPDQSILLQNLQDQLVDVLMDAPRGAPGGAIHKYASGRGNPARLPAVSIYNACGISNVTRADLKAKIANLVAQNNAIDPITGSPLSAAVTSNVAYLLDLLYQEAVRDARRKGVSSATVLATMA